MRRRLLATLWALAALAVAGTANGQTVPSFLAAWGSVGSGPGQLNLPYGIVASPDDHLYVTDQYNFRIVKYTPGGQVVTWWGSQGSGPGQFGVTIGLGVDASGLVYVADFGNNRVQVFSPQGTFVRQWGQLGSATGSFDGPRDIAVDAEGMVHVADQRNRRIQVFTTAGAYVRTWGADEVVNPMSLAFDAAGTAFVCEEAGGVAPGNSVSVWDPAGSLVMRWGTGGSQPGELQTPAGVAIDAYGRVYIADFKNSRVQLFTASGGFLGSWGQLGSSAGRFDHPADVAVDASGYIYVVDMFNHRIQKFGYPTVPAPTVTWGGVKSRYR